MSKATPTSKKRIASKESSLADRRRLELLDAAFAVVAEKGLEGLRTRDVAAKVGMNVATLHYYFATKEDLLVGLVGLVQRKFTERPPPSARVPHEDTLRAHLGSTWWSFNSDPRLSVVLQELVARSHRDAVSRDAFRVLHDFWNAMVADVLRRQIADGSLRADLDPIAGARIVTSYIIGARLQLGVSPQAFVPGAIDDELEKWLAPAARPLPARPPSPAAKLPATSARTKIRKR
jgi:AcrR family transcriptional regulator